MKKLQHPVQRTELDIVVISVIFLVAFFLSNPIFNLSYRDPVERNIAYTGMLLIGIAAMLVTLIVWENLLFSVQLKKVEGGVRVSNHTRKNVIQALLYAAVLVIFLVVFLFYPVHQNHFQVCLGLFTIIPVGHKVISGIRNSNPFLKLTRSEIQFRNHRKRGRFELKKIQYIRIIKGAGNTISKLRLGIDDSEVTIDLDEMHVNAFDDNISDYIRTNYTTLLKY